MIFLVQAATILVLQLLFLFLYTKPMAQFQEPVVKGMIDYWPVNNPYTGPFHRFGWQLAAFFGVIVTLLHAGVLIVAHTYGLCNLWALCTCLFTPALCAIWHWKVFDEAIGGRVYNKVDYIGSSSRLDKWLIKKYGEDAGDKKDMYCLDAIVALNILFIVSTFFL
jgi:hypothetical protein